MNSVITTRYPGRHAAIRKRDYQTHAVSSRFGMAILSEVSNVTLGGSHRCVIVELAPVGAAEPEVATAEREMEAAQRHVAWRPDEDLVLLLMFRNGAGWSRIAEALPGRAGKEVLSRMSQLQVKHGFSASDEGRLVLDSLLLACGIDETA